MVGPDAGLARVAGRWYVQECTDQSDGQSLTMTVGGPGWIWVDQEKVELGARFRVRQYVYFFASGTIRSVLNVAYEANAHIASVWLTPTTPSTVSFTPMSVINAHPENIVGSMFGTVMPSMVNERARAAAEQIGRERFQLALSRGSTITYNTTSGQIDFMLGQLANGVVPRRPVPSPRWLANERQELHAGGIHVSGPFPYQPTATLDVFVEQGGSFQYGTVCAYVAQSAVERLAAGQVQSGPTIPTINVVPGQRYVTRLDPPACEWALVTYSGSDTIVAMAVIP